MENNSVVFCRVTGEQRFVLCNLRMLAQRTSELHGRNNFFKNMSVFKLVFLVLKSLSSWTYGSGVQYCFIVVVFKLTVNVTFKACKKS